MKVLLVDDDVRLCAAVRRGLESEGFAVEVSHTGTEGLWAATESSYDLIILDIMLPGRNGFDVCADLRAADDWTPILMLTAKDGDLDEAEALDTGADDYLVKPFSFPVLVSGRCGDLGVRQPEAPRCRVDPKVPHLNRHRIASHAAAQQGVNPCVDETLARQSATLRTVEESHELRSPLARMRVALEVDLAHPDGADPAGTLRSVLEESVGMQRLVDDLLLLARGEYDGAAQRRESVDLDDLVLREAERLRANRRVSVDLSKVSAARVLGDSSQLARVVRNLTDNAERHAVATVTLTLAEAGDTVEVAVADDGPGIPTTERERVFERFTRLDAARSSPVGARVVVRLPRHQE